MPGNLRAVGHLSHGYFVVPPPLQVAWVSIVLLVVECKKTDRISSGTEDFPHINSHLTYNHINT